ncbi:MAG: hypothetical protein ACM37U_06915 [Gemmatimonas sp.]|nr:hypothetical protein [Gemmatimonadaceae bacterium]
MAQVFAHFVEAEPSGFAFSVAPLGAQCAEVVVAIDDDGPVELRRSAKVGGADE